MKGDSGGCKEFILMAEKVLMCGNGAVGEGAIQAGCRHYFGYPITPQNELTAYMEIGRASCRERV